MESSCGMKDVFISLGGPTPDETLSSEDLLDS